MLAEEDMNTLNIIRQTILVPENRVQYDNFGLTANWESKESFVDALRAAIQQEMAQSRGPAITTTDIDTFKRKYKGSPEELRDLEKFFVKCKGDMGVILEYLPLSEVIDVPRYMSHLLQTTTTTTTAPSGDPSSLSSVAVPPSSFELLRENTTLMSQYRQTLIRSSLQVMESLKTWDGSHDGHGKGGAAAAGGGGGEADGRLRPDPSASSATHPPRKGSPAVVENRDADEGPDGASPADPITAGGGVGSAGGSGGGGGGGSANRRRRMTSIDFEQLEQEIRQRQRLRQAAFPDFIKRLEAKYTPKNQRLRSVSCEPTEDEYAQAELKLNKMQSSKRSINNKPVEKSRNTSQDQFVFPQRQRFKARGKSIYLQKMLEEEAQAALHMQTS